VRHSALEFHRSLPSFQSFDPRPGVDHSIEVTAVAPTVKVWGRALHGYAPNFIEELLIAEDLRRRVTDASVLNQHLRALDGLVRRAGLRQPEPVGKLLLLLGRRAVALDGAKVFKRQRDRSVEVCDYNLGFVTLASIRNSTVSTSESTANGREDVIDDIFVGGIIKLKARLYRFFTSIF
jgi:hypothetical protein